MKITADGQITIPKELRDKYGLHPDTEVELLDADGEMILRRAQPEDEPFPAWVRRMAGSTKGKLTTDQIMEMTRGED
jgi:AbrB family looped-hinge helix DNA binding protein